MMNQINRAIAREEINVLAQHLETRNGVGYVVLDIEKGASDELLSAPESRRRHDPRTDSLLTSRDPPWLDTKAQREKRGTKPGGRLPCSCPRFCVFCGLVHF